MNAAVLALAAAGVLGVAPLRPEVSPEQLRRFRTMQWAGHAYPVVFEASGRFYIGGRVGVTSMQPSTFWAGTWRLGLDGRLWLEQNEYQSGGSLPAKPPYNVLLKLHRSSRAVTGWGWGEPLSFEERP